MGINSNLCIALIVLIWMTLVILLSFSAEGKIKVVEVEKVVYTIPVLPQPEPLTIWEINRMIAMHQWITALDYSLHHFQGAGSTTRIYGTSPLPCSGYLQTRKLQ